PSPGPGYGGGAGRTRNSGPHRCGPNVDVVALEQAIPEDRAVAVDPLVLVDVEADQLAGVVRVGHVPHPGTPLRVPEPVRADAGGRVELRRARRASLRDDLDDAVRRLRAVQRRRGRALDDLDALDVGRVDVVQT